MMGFSINDFKLVSTWTVDQQGKKYQCPCHKQIPQFVIDESTGKKYLNESSIVIRYKCLLLTLGTPLFHPYIVITNVALRILNNRDHYEKMSLDKRIGTLGIEFLRILAIPFSILALDIAAVYGLYSPYDGRKLYATIEKLTRPTYILLAPCFEPNPRYHAFKGKLVERDAF